MKNLVLTAFIAALLAGCARLDHGKTTVSDNEPGPSYYVHDVRLKDGTRCVVSTSSDMTGGTGIVCDWQSAGRIE